MAVRAAGSADMDGVAAVRAASFAEVATATTDTDPRVGILAAGQRCLAGCCWTRRD